MRLTRVYVRFYKSFNYDYERKAKRGAARDPWEILEDGSWYPFVRIDLESDITTVVGANESGKSHLLDAIKKLITGEDIKRSDFCRYSMFFSVERGKVRTPDFGGTFEATTPRDVEMALRHLKIQLAIGDKFNLFRLNGSAPVIYCAGVDEPMAVSATQDELNVVLPVVFGVDAEIPLPDNIPLHSLTGKARKAWGSRRRRGAFIESFGRDWATPEQLAEQAPSIFATLSAAANEVANDAGSGKQQDLARALLFEVAQIDDGTFEDLDNAIDEEREGYVNGVIDKINDALARHLNFPRWWAQDRDFRLMMSPREHELVFTIRDRTGTDYSFSERSHGLRYFLSYYVQLRAHDRTSQQPEILLMDEPDAYLSSQGQQDLLRILEDFARPEDRSREDQVVYVTHSPFLINRNAASRVRVLDKGVGTEGTRVVQDAAQNHYEPLRSSLGPFVAETAFIGGSNLFVEGPADQVLLAGMSSHLRGGSAARIDTLDLNEVTIVPSGGASSVPYMVYLARGRDEVHPPSVALVDGDDAGKKAAKDLQRGGPYRKQVLPPEFVIELGSWIASNAAAIQIAAEVNAREPEDLIPAPVAHAAAKRYATRVLGMPQADAEKLRERDIKSQLASNDGSMWRAVKAAFEGRLGDGAHIEKVGFAKEAIAHVAASLGAPRRPEGVPAMEANYALLLAEIARRLRKAKDAEETDRLNDRLVRALDRFLDDFPTTSRREHGRLLLEAVEDALDATAVGDLIRVEVQALRREFKLDEDLTEPIDEFVEFRERVNNLRYVERFANQAAAMAVAGRFAAHVPRQGARHFRASTIAPTETSPGRGAELGSLSPESPTAPADASADGKAPATTNP